MRSEAGFTIVEVIIAIIILAVGMLALASTSIVATTQVRVADLKTERSLAVMEIVEQLRAGPFSNVTARSEVDAVDAGAYAAWWNVTDLPGQLRRVEVITRGPGYVAGSGWTNMDVDTFTVEIANAAL